ncbi:hypothetical protein [Actinoplanes friuliensis]|nr:hypothetical protein [Actinoplanes friuliensis]
METRPLPAPAVDLSVFVLATVDDHIAAFERIRGHLSAGRPIGAGHRLTLAADSVALAAQYVSRMSSALELPPADRAD